MPMLNILVVEDDLILRQFIKDKLKSFGRVFEASSFTQAQHILSQAPLHLAFIDLNLNSNTEEMEGLKVIQDCRQKKIKSVVLTSHEEQEVIDQAFELGCSHFFAKRELQETFETYILSLFQRQDRQKKLKKLIDEHLHTDHKKFKEDILEILEKSLKINQSILILGETGVGKTELAKFIHKVTLSSRPFVNKNLAEVSTTLLESELFGHVKGAFTGAHQDKIGLIERAHGGTLFLDEIGALPKETQQKLLKVIEEKEFMPLGSTELKKSDFRLITATCDNLDLLIKENKFRTDFYFRICGQKLLIPPLRERSSDIENLFKLFTSNSARKISLSKECKEKLKAYSWPGNIRELKHLCESFLSQHESYIEAQHLPFYIQEPRLSGDSSQDEFLSPSNIYFIENYGLPELIKKIELEALRKWQEKHPGKINAVAKELKISKSVFYRILEGLNESEV